MLSPSVASTSREPSLDPWPSAQPLQSLETIVSGTGSGSPTTRPQPARTSSEQAATAVAAAVRCPKISSVVGLVRRLAHGLGGGPLRRTSLCVHEWAPRVAALADFERGSSG